MDAWSPISRFAHHADNVSKEGCAALMSNVDVFALNAAYFEALAKTFKMSHIKGKYSHI